MGTCITSRWTLAQGRSDRCTVKAGSMVKKVALSLLALIPFLSITGYVITSISHSSRFIYVHTRIHTYTYTYTYTHTYIYICTYTCTVQVAFRIDTSIELIELWLMAVHMRHVFSNELSNIHTNGTKCFCAGRWRHATLVSPRPNPSIYIYIYIYIYTYMYYIYLCVDISLSLSIYIYIYICI